MANQVKSSRLSASTILVAISLLGATAAHGQTWIQLTPTGQAPDAVSNMNADYDATGNNMIVFGGGFIPRNNITSVLSNANGFGTTPNWTQLSPTGQLPPERSGHSVVYDSVDNRLIIYGGFTGSGDSEPFLNDVWVLTNANGQGASPVWEELFPTGGPPTQRAYPTAVYDPGSNRMVVFGGCTGWDSSSCNTLLNDVWLLTNANGLGGAPQWIQLQPSGPLPPARVLHTAVFDPASNRMIVFAGDAGGFLVSDVWILSNANGLGGTPQWTQLQPTSSVPARDNHTAIYDPNTNRMTVFSGFTALVNGTLAETNDVWVLTNANGQGGAPTWTQLSPAGSQPLPRENADAIYDPTSNRMTIFSGLSSGARLSDVWVLTNANGIVSSQVGITQVLPNDGGNAGTNTAQIIGSGFSQGTTVNLACGGQVSVPGTNTVVGANGTMITATFNLQGTAPGKCDVVVTNPDGTTVTDSQAFTVEQGGAPQIWVDIVGLNKIRIGAPQTYYVVVGNSGNVDSSPGLVSFTVPATVQTTQTSGVDLIATGTTSDPQYQIPLSAGGSSMALVFATPGVPAGGTQSVPVQLTLPSSAPSSAFTIAAVSQSDLYPGSFDEYLTQNGIAFIPLNSSCGSCSDEYEYEEDTYLNAFVNYQPFQNAESNIQNVVAAASVGIAGTVGGAAVLAGLGVTGLGAVSLGAIISVGTTCVSQLIVDQSCVRNYLNLIVIAKNAVVTCLAGNTSTCYGGNPLPSNVASALKWFNIYLNAAITGINGLLAEGSAILASDEAFAVFQQSLPAYTSARSAYLTCLSTCGGNPNPSPPPNPPWTALPVTPVTSLDPNDKAGSTGSGTLQYISGATPLRYIVEFSNAQAATAPAQKVVITDQLDTTDDNLGTLSPGPISFGGQLFTPPAFQTNYSSTVDLRPTTNLLVGVNGNLNASTGLLTWTFQSLDPSTGLPPTDPTAGFLPPGGEASVFFTVMPKPGLPTNTQIQNQASIVFDVNPAIATQTWLNTLDNTPPTSSVQALPVSEPSSNFTVTWSGTDVGAGVQDYTIYVSDNSGAFTAFLTNTTATSATFAGQMGHTYGFYSIARDLVGNIEPAKASAEATTMVGCGSALPVTVAGLSGPPGNNGWYRGPVQVTLSATDATSTIAQTFYTLDAAPQATYTIPFTVSGEAIHQLSYYSVDVCSDQEKPNTTPIKIDATPPVTTATPSGIMGSNGWYRSPVALSFVATDNLSGVASTVVNINGVAAATAETNLILNADGIYNVVFYSIDVAGNMEAPKSIQIKIDQTPPSIACSLFPLPNANGWNNTPVTIGFAASDPVSGIASVSPAVTLTGEGAKQAVTGLATDNAGNAASVSCQVNIDLTPPEAYLQFDPTSKDVDVYGTDALSGVPPGPVAPLSVQVAGWDDDDKDDRAWRNDRNDHDARSDDHARADSRDDRDQRGDRRDDRNRRDDWDRDRTTTEIRTYKISDLAGNILLVVVKVRKDENHLEWHILGLEYQSNPALVPTNNHAHVEWEFSDRDRILRTLDQEISIGRGRDSQEVNAEFENRPNETVIQIEGEPRQRPVKKPGLDLLRLATQVGKLAIQF